MSEGGADSGNQRLPYSQQGRSPRRQTQQPTGSSAAHQMAGYIMPPQQQQHAMQYPSGGGGYNVYPPPHAGQMYQQHPPVGPQHLQQPPPPHYAAAATSGAAVAGMAAQMPMGQSQTYASGMQAQHPSQPMQHESYIQPRIGRLPADRPIMKLSISLIETYKDINHVSH